MANSPYWNKLICASTLLATFIIVGCVRQTSNDNVFNLSTPDLTRTADPKMAQTLQADVQITAAALVTLVPVPTPTGAPLPSFDVANNGGTPIAEHTGDCPVPDGFLLNTRAGFCIAAPTSWTPLNVDGGLAASLGTTPGQALSLRPDWADTSDVCHLLIYIAPEASAQDHLNTRYAEFATRSDISQLSPVQISSLADMLLPGFYWGINSGATGAIYADILGPNRLVHISFGGTDCSVDQLNPILETLRFQ